MMTPDNAIEWLEDVLQSDKKLIDNQNAILEAQDRFIRKQQDLIDALQQLLLAMRGDSK